jgi:hypothetical protein
VVKAVEERLVEIRSAGKISDADRESIRQSLRTMSPWDALKTAGEAALPSGDCTSRYMALKQMLRSANIWLVPVGQLEGFCKAIPGKTGWVQRLLVERDLAFDPELEAARAFVSDIVHRHHPLDTRAPTPP